MTVTTRELAVASAPPTPRIGPRNQRTCRIVNKLHTLEQGLVAEAGDTDATSEAQGSAGRIVIDGGVALDDGIAHHDIAVGIDAAAGEG